MDTCTTLSLAKEYGSMMVLMYNYMLRSKAAERQEKQRSEAVNSFKSGKCRQSFTYKPIVWSQIYSIVFENICH